MRRRQVALCVLMIAAMDAVAASGDSPAETFRRGNENAVRSRWDDALSEYRQVDAEGVHAPSLYWNWAQAATASGKKGEALWALLRAEELTPRDPSIAREIERLRGDLGLDPSEISLGFLGDVRRIARRFRFDIVAMAALSFSIVALLGKRPRRALSLASSLTGLVLLAPYGAGAMREIRGVVVQKDAPLLDAARNDAVALANLREGEVAPILSEEGDFVRIQDASGARGFAHKSDVLRIGME